MKRLFFSILCTLVAIVIGVNFVRYTILTSNGETEVEPLDVFVVMDVISSVDMPVEEMFVDIGDSLKGVAQAMDGFVDALNLNHKAQGDFFSMVIGFFTGIWGILVGVGSFAVSIVKLAVFLFEFLYRLLLVVYRLFDLLLGTNFALA